MWYDETVFYQIYPLGFCGAPQHNDGIQTHRIRKVLNWIGHLKKLGVGGVYFGPVFESDEHGYDTRDYRKIDVRLGTQEDFRDVADALHEAGIRVVLDGVFNHVGRGFWAFKDVQEKRENSPYKDWFHIRFDGNSPYNDGFWYEGWEGYYNLVKLNLNNPAVRDYLLSCVDFWIDEFGIDGIRLDVAYCLTDEFMQLLSAHVRQRNPEFFLLGEILHGDYNRLVNDRMLQSATNYECYKGLYSSMNSYNLFEIAYSLNRQFGSEPWTLYRGKNLWTFVDNHDVNRIASTLTNQAHLPLIYALAFGMPGIPCIYYGSEWGAKGIKENGSDAGIRQCYEAPVWNDLTSFIAAASHARSSSEALAHGGYRQLALTNRQFVFERESDLDRVIVALNIDENPFTMHFNARAGEGVDLLTGRKHDFGGGSQLPGYSAFFWRVPKS